MLTENDPNHSLEHRLAIHHDVLTSRSGGATYALTRATVGHAPAATIYGIEKERVTGIPHVPPRQHPDHTPGLPDAYYAQLFPTDWLSRPWDPAQWIREDLPDGRTLLTAREAKDWFVERPDERGRDGWTEYEPTAAAHAAARASLTGLLQRPSS